MRIVILLAVALAAPASAQAVQPGAWVVRSTAVDLTIPGAPGFILRMMKGKSKSENKCLLPAQAQAGVAALFAPKPEAKCTVERAIFANGRVEHLMSCPQKKGAPVHVARVGTYTATGFTARMTVTGQTPKGDMRIVADQVATRTGPVCRR